MLDQENSVIFKQNMNDDEVADLFYSMIKRLNEFDTDSISAKAKIQFDRNVIKEAYQDVYNKLICNA